ncbi:MAG: DoxX family membrane protein [Verrucomicrobia bacterium]|nr:DoxX family membrane protein [Verrucomicrobiota bacterium]
MSAWVTILGRLVLGGVFVAAGALKVVDPKAFARAIVDYDLAPEVVVPALAVVLPWWEVIAGALAIIGRWRLGALGALTLMSAGFFAIGVVTLWRGLSPECACFGFLSERVGPASVGLEALLVVVGGLLLWIQARGAGSAQK